MSCNDCDYRNFCDERPRVWEYIATFIAGIGFLASVIAIVTFYGVRI